LTRLYDQVFVSKVLSYSTADIVLYFVSVHPSEETEPTYIAFPLGTLSQSGSVFYALESEVGRTGWSSDIFASANSFL